MTRRKSVAGVDANAHALLVVHQLNDVPEILPRRADDVSSAGHVLQYRDDAGRRLVGLVQLRRDARTSCLLRIAARITRVEVVKLYPQLLAALQIVQEAVVSLGGLFLVCLREVD